MPEYVIRVDSPAEALAMQERAARELLEGIHTAQIDSAHATLAVVVSDTDAAGLVDLGAYKNSWDVVDKGEEVRLVNDAPYAGVIEQGARPFTPPLQPLVDWAERKAADLGLVGDAQLDGQGQFRGRHSLESAQRQAAKRIARAIQRKFAREGYRPRYIMRNRLPYALQQLKRAIREHVDRVARGGGRGPGHGSGPNSGGSLPGSPAA